jgi:aldoxime dehydratase
MESAIPHRLTQERSIERRVPESYEPPYPAWVARFSDAVEGVVMAYFGIQAERPVPANAFASIEAQLRADSGPRHVDRARYVDEAGYDTRIAIAYWDDPASFDRWFAAFRSFWDSASLGSDGLGYFAEIVRPRVERFETLFSTLGRPEGIAVLASGMSEPIKEHAYWGSARERIPLAQIDPLTSAATAATINVSGVANGSAAAIERVRVPPQGNLCLIRSGQDWSATTGQEREIYLRDVEPALREGMTYLRDGGLEIGCYDCRYADVIEEGAQISERTFGLAYFKEILDMERWAESHPTHVEIFGRFMKAVQQLEFNLKLRLYHEVTVAAENEQFFEYVNCHPRTGLLKSLHVDGAVTTS